MERPKLTRLKRERESVCIHEWKEKFDGTEMKIVEVLKGSVFNKKTSLYLLLTFSLKRGVINKGDSATKGKSLLQKRNGKKPSKHSLWMTVQVCICDNDFPEVFTTACQHYSLITFWCSV